MEAERTTARQNDIEDVIAPLLMVSVEEMIEQSMGHHLNLTQILQIILVSPSPFFDSLQTFMSIFAHAQPAWHFTNTSTSTSTSNICNLSRDEWDWNSGNETFTSIISEWDLQCANSLTVGFPATCYFVGCLLGGLVFATLGDSSLGRKNLLCISSLVMSLTALASSFASNFWVYSIFRFVCGIGRAPLAVCALVLLIERVAKRWRSQALMIGFTFSSLGIFVLSGVGYLCRENSWRTLYLWTSIPGIIYSISCFFFMHESPRWLLLQGRVQEAIDALTCLGQPMKNISYIKHMVRPITSTRSDDLFAALKVLISKRWAIKRLISTMFLSFGVGLMYFGILLGVQDLGSDIYMTSTLHALLALASFLLTFLYWIPKCNRKISLFGFCVLSGETSIILSFLAYYGYKSKVVIVGMELVSMFCACMSYNIVMMYTVELFPTCVRTSASSLVRQAMILGSVFDPLLVLLGSGNILYSYGVFGLVMLLCGVLVLVLCFPETKGKVLCDTMEEQEYRDNESALTL